MPHSVEIRPCPVCLVENQVDAAQCHACGQPFRYARAQVLTVPLSTLPKAAPREVKKQQKSALVHCFLKLESLVWKKYDISGIHFE